MKLLILPGNSYRNKKEMKKVANHLKGIFKETYIHNYLHWKTGQKLINLEEERKIIAKKINKKDWVIFAKSIGIILALNLIHENKIKPQAVILAGTPIKWLKENKIQFKKQFKNLNIKSLFIQKNKDPICPSKYLKKFIKKSKITNSQFLEIEGNNHNYNLPNIHEIVKYFLKSIKK